LSVSAFKRGWLIVLVLEDYGNDEICGKKIKKEKK
jgi:hypothetical protein